MNECTWIIYKYLLILFIIKIIRYFRKIIILFCCGTDKLLPVISIWHSVADFLWSKDSLLTSLIMNSMFWKHFFFLFLFHYDKNSSIYMTNINQRIIVCGQVKTSIHDWLHADVCFKIEQVLQVNKPLKGIAVWLFCYR